MRGILPGAVLLCVAAAAAPDEAKLVFGKKPYKVRPLEFTVLLPDGWQASQDRTGMVAQAARDPKGMGFLVSREPFLHDPKEFGTTWESVLTSAGIEAKVGKTRSGKFAGWSAVWDTASGGGRRIEVHRIHVPDTEMLYNFSFSGSRGSDLKPLVAGVLRGFKFKGERPKLEFKATAESLGARSSFTLPKGYVAPQGPPRGGYQWSKMLPGYAEPHEAGRIQIGQIRQRISAKDAVEVVLSKVKGTLELVGKPRRRAAKYGGMKGHQLTARAKSREGLPKVLFAFAFAPQGSAPITLTAVVDDREVRLYKDLFKQLCNHLDLGG